MLHTFRNSSLFTRSLSTPVRSFTSCSVNSKAKPPLSESKSKPSTSTDTDSPTLSKSESSEPQAEPTSNKKKKTTAEIDAEAIARMEERFGGRDTGQLHLVDGKPSSIASHVQKNFFRYI